MSILAEMQPSRQGYVSAVCLLGTGGVPSQAGEVQPAWLCFRELADSRPEYSGPRWVGSWLDCRFHYCKPGSKFPYHVSAAVYVSRAGRIGRVFLRSCSCPDGLARAGQKGAMRHCKHMVALHARLSSAASVKSSSLLAGAWASDQAQYSDAALGSPAWLGPEFSAEPAPTSGRALAAIAAGEQVRAVESRSGYPNNGATAPDRDAALAA